MPPEKSAYALARYSRSPDSIRDSIEWVRTHDSRSFLESYYFQYGHASIADLGHTVVCFEGISELAATEIEAEPLWDGQAKSSRYQDFSRSGFVTPPELSAADAEAYRATGEALLAAYSKVNELALACLSERYPRPEEMKPGAYRRHIAARAFDVARYLLFWGVPTNVGQVTSIRTLEKQIRRLKVSEYQEVRELSQELAGACAAEPDCRWDVNAAAEPVAPTLARHADPDEHSARSREDLRLWARQNLTAREAAPPPRVDLLRPTHVPSDIVATLLYPVTDRPFRELYELACGWSQGRRGEVIDVALGSRTQRDALLDNFRGGLYAYDLAIDIGAYRDLHRHRRCQQFRQDYSGNLGFDTPRLVSEAGASDIYESAMAGALDTMHRLAAPGAHYLLPFGARSRFLFKMDFAEAEYIARLRSGVKGHFSYREIAWEMKCKMEQLEPELGRLIEATPPWVEDPLKR
ncbi:MAG: alternative thymidylate synthase-like protein [Terriglobia bacterium]|nr:MAG: alternative thymidylate synthase-like protein [Terriglobia bacterium]